MIQFPRNKVIIFTLTLFGLFFTVHAASAATYHVKKTGSDANNCTQAQNEATPKSTISSAVACLGTGNGAGAGHTVRVYAGTYNEVLNNNMPGGSAEDQRFTFEGNPGDTVIIQPTQNYHAIRLANPTVHKYITIRNLVIDGVRAFGTETPGGIVVDDDAIHHITLENIEVKNISDSAIFMRGSYHLLTRLNVHDNGHHCFSSDPGLCHGLYLATNHSILEYSSLHDNTGAGAKFYAAGKNLVANIFRYNIAYNNGAVGLLNAGTGSIYNNVIYNNARRGIWSFSAAVYNNTIYGSYANGDNPGYCIQLDWGSPIVRNNICYNNAANSIGLAYGATTANADYNLYTDPSFTNASALNFHLQSFSPAINAGATLSEVTTDFDGISRPQGSAYDIGAYEYAGSTPPPTFFSADLNSDSRVNSVDAAILMGAWGQTSRPSADINKDGIVNSVDASMMMGQWTG